MSPGAQTAYAQAPSPFDGQYTGELKLAQVIDGDCMPPPARGAVSADCLRRGGPFRLSAAFRDGSDRQRRAERQLYGLSPDKERVVRMTGEIRGNGGSRADQIAELRYGFRDGELAAIRTR